MGKTNKKAKTVAQAQGKETETVDEIHADTPIAFLEQLGVKLTEEQKSSIQSQLRVRAKRAGGGRKAYVRLVDTIPADAKLNRQKKALVEALPLDHPLTSEEWIEACGDNLETRQDPMRVLNFYKKDLLDAGLIGLAQ